jgi:hypothetical protein
MSCLCRKTEERNKQNKQDPAGTQEEKKSWEGKDEFLFVHSKPDPIVQGRGRS